ncbi:hypothetical protein D3C72_2164540 [compost metagenome]
MVMPKRASAVGAAAFICAVGIGLPNSTHGLSTLRPPLSVSRSAPSASSMRAVTAESAGWLPPGTPSLTLSLQHTASPLPTASLTCRSTAAGKRVRFSTLPPNASRRRLLSGDRNWLSR